MEFAISDMGLPDILFFVFAALTLLCATLVVFNPFSRTLHPMRMMLA